MSNSMKLLLVEDEPKVASLIRETLSEFGFEIDHAFDGLQGKEMALNQKYDLIILDLILPHINGKDLCREIRKENKKIPILMLTALDSSDDLVSGFDAGADDYLGKPFEFKVLNARISALIRRSQEERFNQKIIKFKNLELNLDRKNAKRDASTIELTAKEFNLLEFLMRNPEKVLSRKDIAKKVWDLDFDTGTNIVDVYVNFLRKKIDKNFEPKLIHTSIGNGYVFGEK